MVQAAEQGCICLADRQILINAVGMMPVLQHILIQIAFIAEMRFAGRHTALGMAAFGILDQVALAAFSNTISASRTASASLASSTAAPQRRPYEVSVLEQEKAMQISTWLLISGNRPI